MAAPVVDILMYHSISDGASPTSIPAAAFRMQMAAIARAGVPVISLDDFLAAKAGRHTLAPRSVIVTFDDGFQDFADVAWPVMKPLGFHPIVYLPSAHVGRHENWAHCHSPARKIMDWPTIRQLAAQGVMFGNHTVSHPHLPLVAPDVVDAELTTARQQISSMLGTKVRHFAAPYGASTPAIRRKIAQHHATNVSTVLASATLDSDPHDLPRLEMFYFTNPWLWRRHLAGGGGAYLAARRLIRQTKQALGR